MVYVILPSALFSLANAVLVIFQKLAGREISQWQWILLQCSIGASCSYTFYCLVLYPRVFTPFKSLPTPVVCYHVLIRFNNRSDKFKTRHVVTGNERGLFKEPQWTVARRVSETVPNSGLVRYYAALNQERILVTSPAALAEVLVQRVDDFDHPAFMKFAAERVTGKGMQFANGEEHKVCLNPTDRLCDQYDDVLLDAAQVFNACL
jgi:hypothetical protein